MAEGVEQAAGGECDPLVSTWAFSAPQSKITVEEPLED